MYQIHHTKPYSLNICVCLLQWNLLARLLVIARTFLSTEDAFISQSLRLELTKNDFV